MSSRILERDQSGRATTIVWRKVDPPPSPAAAPAASGAEADARQNTPEPAAPEVRTHQLQSEMASREAQAREAGRAEGDAAARQALEQPIKEALSRLAHQLEQLAQVRQHLRHTAEQDLVKLAIEIARRILRRELATDPSAILGLVKAALERVAARDVLRVRSHPEDARTIETCFGDLGMPERIEVVADQNLERGAVILETTRGQLDASVETQLQEIERGFADRIHSR